MQPKERSRYVLVPWKAIDDLGLRAAPVLCWRVQVGRSTSACTQRNLEHPVTISLTPELEQALAEAARRQGTTPEILASEFLRERLLPAVTPDPDLAESGTLAESLADFIGILSSSEFVEGGAQFSERTGEQFTAGLMARREQGHL